MRNTRRYGASSMSGSRIPVVDPRSVDEIMYDENGVPR